MHKMLKTVKLKIENIIICIIIYSIYAITLIKNWLISNYRVLYDFYIKKYNETY